MNNPEFILTQEQPKILSVLIDGQKAGEIREFSPSKWQVKGSWFDWIEFSDEMYCRAIFEPDNRVKYKAYSNQLLIPIF